MNLPLERLLLALSLVPTAVLADTNPMQPGLYEIKVGIVMPNVQNAAAPATVSRCIRQSDLDNGAAYPVLGDNPIKACPMMDYTLHDNKLGYRIVCAGPNAPSAIGAFLLGATGFQGEIVMQMGGKNMTMSETQAARRLGECKAGQ